MRRPRRNHAPAFKVRVVLEALKGEKTVAEIVKQFDVHPHLVTHCFIDFCRVQAYGRSSAS